MLAEKIALFDIDDVLLERTSHKPTWQNSGLFSSLAWNAPMNFFSAAYYGAMHSKEIKKSIAPFAQQNPDVGIVEGLATTDTPVGLFLKTKLPAYGDKTVSDILIDEYIADGTSIEASVELVEDLQKNGYKIGYATNMSDRAYSKILAKNLLPEKNPIISATSTGISLQGKPFDMYGSVLKKAYDFEKEEDAAEKIKKKKNDDTAEYFKKLGEALKKSGIKIDQLLFIDNKKANLVEHKKKIFAQALGIDEKLIHFIHFTLDKKAEGVQEEIKKINKVS
jgi:FMN phosphatase YigB (HAD superfamily)